MNELLSSWDDFFTGLSGPMVQLRLERERANHLRFADSRITQNSCLDELQLQMTLAEPWADAYRTVQGAGTDADPARLYAQLAPELAEAPLNREFKGFFQQSPDVLHPLWYENTARIALEEKAEWLRERIQAAADLAVGGIFVTGEGESWVQHDTTRRGEQRSHWMMDVRYRNDEGHCASFRAIGRDLSRADVEALAEAAAERCRANRPTSPPADGRYPVLFAPDAVSELVYFLSLCGLGGREYRQGRGPFAGRLGQTVIDNPLIRLTDNPFHPDTLTENVGRDGIARRVLPLIDRGVLRNVAWSLEAAERAEDATGHAQGYPMLLELDGGDRTADELAETPGAILISRFHYPTIDDPNRIVLKGKSRDGSFLNRPGGRVAIPDLEFHLEIPRLLEKTIALSRERQVLPQGSLASSLPGANIVPWLLTGELELEGNQIRC